MLHLLFVVAVVIIAMALLPAALVVLPWLLAVALVVIGIGLLIALFAYAPEMAVALVATAGVVAALYSLQSLRQGGGHRDTAKTPSESPGQPTDPLGSALQQLHAALTTQVKDLERELQHSRERIQPTVERRKELAKTLRLGERLLLVVGDIKYYPSWSERDPATVCDLVSNVVVAEKAIHDYTVQFEFKQRRYAIEYEKRWFVGPDGNDSGPYFGDVTLRSPESVEVFTGRFSEGEYGERVEFHDIEAFRPGVWLDEFLELAERIDAIGRERKLRYELGQVQTQRERFGIDADVVGLDGDAPTGGMSPGEPQPGPLPARFGRAVARWVRWIRLPR